MWGAEDDSAMKIKTIIWIVILLVLLAGVTAWTWKLHGCPRIGIDDANIFFTYAENLASGNGITYGQNGERVEGCHQERENPDGRPGNACRAGVLPCLDPSIARIHHMDDHHLDGYVPVGLDHCGHDLISHSAAPIDHGRCHLHGRFWPCACHSA